MRHYLARKVSSRLIITFVFTLSAVWPCYAHDTWLMPIPSPTNQPLTDARPRVLVPGTGDFFPRPDFLTPSDRIEATDCRDAEQVFSHQLQDNPVLGFQIELNQAASSNPTFCSLKLEREYIELDLDKVPVYLDDISASTTLRKEWMRRKTQGNIWKEYYTKTARVELSDTLSHQATGVSADAVIARSFGPHAEILSAKAGQKLKPGQSGQFVLLHKGQPLPNQPVEWINGDTGQRGWLKTNAKGTVSVPIQASGLWMLRGTIIRFVKNQPFESDFFTLVFRVNN